MSRTGLENVKILVGESNVQVRRTVTDTLRQEGFSSIRDTSDFKDIEESINENTVDVLICDVELGGGDLSELIYNVRHHIVGANPFIVTISLTDNPTTDMIRKIINSGSDDLLLKPISVGQILDRLKILTYKRKGFVVTTDYIGPDRRKNGPRPGTQEIPIIDVPNPLSHHMGIDGKPNMMAIQDAISQASRLINNQKMERHAQQIQYLVDRIVPSYSVGEVGHELFAQVERLVYVSEDLVRRMTGTYYEHVRELGESMIKVSSRIKAKSEMPDFKDLSLLPQLASAISKAFTEDEKTAAVARDIADSIGR